MNQNIFDTIAKIIEGNSSKIWRVRTNISNYKYGGTTIYIKAPTKIAVINKLFEINEWTDGYSMLERLLSDTATVMTDSTDYIDSRDILERICNQRYDHKIAESYIQENKSFIADMLNKYNKNITPIEII